MLFAGWEVRIQVIDNITHLFLTKFLFSVHVLLLLFSVTVLQFVHFAIFYYNYYTEEPLLSGHPKEGKGGA